VVYIIEMGFLCSVNLIRGQHWNRSISYKSTKYLHIANSFWKERKTDIRQPIKKFEFWIICLRGTILAVRLGRLPRKSNDMGFCRETSTEVSHQVLYSIPLVFFQSAPHSFIIMNNSRPWGPMVTVPLFIKDNGKFVSNFHKDRNKPFVLYHPNTSKFVSV